MKIILKISLICAILFGIIAIPVLAATGKVVNTNEVRFRAKPSATEDSEVLGKIPKDTQLEILEKNDGWYKVIYNEKTGYISADYIEEIQNSNQENTNVSESNNVPQTNNSENIITTYKISKKSSLRLMPLINSSVIFNIEQGTDCNMVTTAGKWAYIETNVVKGWVLKDCVQSIETKTETGTETKDSNIENLPQTTTVYSNSKVGKINTNSTNVRKQPNISGELVTQLNLNAQVTVLGEDGDWYLIEVNSTKAYVYKELISNLQ